MAEKILTRIAAGVLLLSISVPAAAQMQLQCAERAKVFDHLRTEYGEVPVARGILEGGNVIEVLASDRTFTIVVSLPDGRTCLIGAGQNWQTVPKGRDA